MPRASQGESPAASRHADTIHFILVEARSAGVLRLAGQIQRTEREAGPLRAGLSAGHDRRTELADADLDPGRRLDVLLGRGRAPGMRDLSDPRETHRVPPVHHRRGRPLHATLQPKGRWVKHPNTQLGSVESTLDVIADYMDA